MASFIQEGAFYIPAPGIVLFYLFMISLVIGIWNGKEAVFSSILSV